MDMKKVNKKEKKQDDVIILDKGIDSRGVIETLGWICCSSSVWPYRML